MIITYDEYIYILRIKKMIMIIIIIIHIHIFHNMVVIIVPYRYHEIIGIPYLRFPSMLWLLNGGNLLFINKSVGDLDTFMRIQPALMERDMFSLFNQLHGDIPTMYIYILYNILYIM